MLNLKTIQLLIFGFIIICKVKGQGTDITLELLQSIQNQVDALNANNAFYQGEIENLKIQLQNQIDRELSDFNLLNNNIDGLYLDVSSLRNRIGNAELDIGALKENIGILELGLDEVNGKVVKLEGTNKIWRANFQVVNKTFAELRKKFKFVISGIQLPVVKIAVPKARTG